MRVFIYVTSLAIGLMFAHQSYGQTLSRTVIGSTGSVNNELSYTVGEAVIETGSGGSLVLTQGFQQPDKLTGTSNDPLLGRADYVLYPNPTQDHLILEITTDKPQSFAVEFIDLRGRRVGEVRQLEPGTNIKETFATSHLAEGTYVLLLKSTSGRILDQMRFRKLD
jgi:hypothetical protein